MDNGISIYTGLNCSLEENLELIEMAASLGLRRIFTSVLIPEADSDLQAEFATVLVAAVENDFEVIIDVMPTTIADFDFAFDFEQITLRLDDGFTAAQIVELSYKRKVQLNASTVTNEFLTTLLNLDANFQNISALHNFYPQIHTGLDTYFFSEQTKLLHDFDIEVGAFVPTLEGKRRPPFGEGLPTLEDCRDFSTDLAARFLSALGTDFIIIGDGLPTEDECKALVNVREDEVIMRARLLTDDLTSIELLNNSFTRRPDVSKSVIRAVEGRQFLKNSGGNIEPDGFPVERSFGDVTIANDHFGRYAGEVQIVDNNLPADSRVNTVAKIVEEEIFLTSYLRPRQKFSLRFV